MMKVFLDTNVVVDMLCDRMPFAKEADYIFRLGLEHKFDILISSLTIVNAHFICHKYELADNVVIQSLHKLCSSCHITNIDSNIINKALAEPGVDLEDTVQMLSAEAAGAVYIVTRDKKGYAGSAVTPLTPSEFLKLKCLAH